MIPDLASAVGSRVHLSSEADVINQALALVLSVPRPVWGRGRAWCGRDVELQLGSRLGSDPNRYLEVAGEPPNHGRAPGWNAEVTVGERQMTELSITEPSRIETRCRLSCTVAHGVLHWRDGTGRWNPACDEAGPRVARGEPSALTEARLRTGRCRVPPRRPGRGGISAHRRRQRRRRPQARALSIFAGVGLIAFEAAELAWIGFQPLEVVFGTVGVAVMVPRPSSGICRCISSPRPRDERETCQASSGIANP